MQARRPPLRGAFIEFNILVYGAYVSLGALALVVRLSVERRMALGGSAERLKDDDTI